MSKNLFFLILLLFTACTRPTTVDMLADAASWDEGTPLTGHLLTSDSSAELRFFTRKDFSDMRNFELRMELQASEEAVGEIFFHCSPDDPGKGYKVKIDNSLAGDRNRLVKTGSLTGVRNLCYQTVKPGEWFTLTIRVEENRIRTFINNYPAVDYTEPDEPFRPENIKNRRVSSGMIAVAPGIKGIAIRKMELEKLPDGERKACSDVAYTKRITALHAQFCPLADYHVHIKGTLTMDQALDSSAALGINYGIAANCGLLFPVTNDSQLYAYMESIKGLPIFRAMQAEGREWVDLFSPEAIAQFDYVFTDAMTWTNQKGMRMRLWIPEEVEIGDPQDFMEQLVSQIEKVVTEPIDIYVNPTYLPEALAARYDELWTPERIDRVVKALKENNVALEINSRLRLPGPAVIAKAKEAGVRFSMGTNNTDEHLGRSDYALEMIERFGIGPEQLFLPGEYRRKATAR